jgi:hypothetical protein
MLMDFEDANVWFIDYVIGVAFRTTQVSQII